MKYMIYLAVCVAAVTSCGNSGPEPVAVQEMPELEIDTLQVALEIGVEVGDSTNTFSAIVAALLDSSGRILVLDQPAACLKVFDIEGNFISQESRPGNGPGELIMPWDMFLMPDGRLVVIDPGKMGFVVFSDSLNFLEEIGLWPQNPPFQGTPVSDSQYVAYKIDTDMADNSIIMRRTVAIYSWGEEEWDRILWQDSLVASMNEIMDNPSKLFIDLLDPLSIGGDGSNGIFFSLKDSEEYIITGWNSSGDEILNFSMALEPVNKTPEGIAAESTYVNNYINRISGGGGAGMIFEPDPYRDMVTGVDIGPDGNLWVRRGTVDSPFFDIYSLDGEPLYHAVFPAEGWSWKTSVTQQGILAWEEDPETGYQKLYVLK
jgi:hypothetical protein